MKLTKLVDGFNRKCVRIRKNPCQSLDYWPDQLGVRY